MKFSKARYLIYPRFCFTLVLTMLSLINKDFTKVHLPNTPQLPFILLFI